MAASQQAVVGTAPTLLVSAPVVGVGTGPGPQGWFQLANGTVATVYLGGGTTVSTATGYPLGTSSSTVAPNVLNGYLFSGDSVYGIVASGTATVNVIQTGV